ncbi:tautomerase enzyme [Cupriavidus sp. L7L]|uniref:tautomerase family protein n=1 Tax=Cupriavidus sp. L7L TaxID=2546443 RepID=UPI00105520F2|nr:tautomerase enzyme [Cupriavidus sp. L7L]TDF64540.1 tautomerase enzyme [Cupriavidus sp. L7L]
MTIISVTAPRGRFDLEQRQHLAKTLTDAVLIPEVGQPAAAARVGFRVHFVELEAGCMAIGGRLLAEAPQDILTVDVAVMDAAWPQPVRTRVIEGILAALATAGGMPVPAPAWWVNFRVIEDGSWGSRGNVLRITDLLESSVFTPERVAEIRAALL